MTWPALSNKGRWVYYVIGYIYIAITYMVTNRQTWQIPHQLRMTIIDNSIPFLPWTGWIYATIYVLPLIATVFIRKVDEIKVLLFVFICTATICSLVFAFYPTIYPRPKMISQGFWSLPLEVIRGADFPGNCWPSEHVAFSFLSAFIMYRSSSKWGNFLIFWSVLIGISTLTTKQHYVWDVVAGYALARVVYVITERSLLPNLSR